MKKDGQMQLSFGMIFSIILIIAFVAFAFYAIQKFLGVKEEAEIGKFTDNLQGDIDKLWRGSQGSQEVEYSLPSKIKKVCFKDDEYENLIFESDEFISGKKIEHINIDEITQTKNPFCFDVSDGQVKFVIKKNFGEVLVRIEK